MSNSSKKIHTIVVDRKACIGAATCVVIAPNAFELDSDGISTVRASFSHCTQDELIQAAQSCPVKAIKLLDEKGEEI